MATPAPPAVRRGRETNEKREQAGQQASERREELPLWDVVLLDDPCHTHAYVVHMLGRLFGTPTGRGLRQAVEVDTTGSVVVARLHRELAELKRDQIRGFGDLAMPLCRGSMNAVIVPAQA